MTAPLWPAESGATSGAKSLAESVVTASALDFAEDSRKGAGRRRVTGAKSETRLLRGPASPQSRPRPHSGDYRYRLLPRLTDRDLEIVRAVWRLNVLTANHICEMFFDTRGRGLVRLKQLYEMGVLDRFRPYREGGGSEPYHYVLGREGAAVVAAWTGANVDQAVRRYRGAFGIALARRAVLARSVAVSAFYARLVATQRVNPRCKLLDWMRPEEVEKWTQGIIREAWFGEWQEESRVEQFFLVPDPGGSVEKLLDELYRYDRFEEERGDHAHVILVCTSWQRADQVSITQRRADRDGLVEKDGKTLHNRYRVLGPTVDPGGLLTPGENDCPWREQGRGWLYNRLPAGEGGS
ncbi:MAG: hypothetical protein QOK43_2201 [Acidimicrobiaceae bacterium]|nr:hypothetical protein [Acidimicrobiaceae bacterium]